MNNMTIETMIVVNLMKNSFDIRTVTLCNVTSIYDFFDNNDQTNNNIFDHISYTHTTVMKSM